MSKSKDDFLNYQEEQHYASEAAQELGFIARNTSAHYKGQDLLMNIQSSRLKLAMLKSEIAKAPAEGYEDPAADAQLYLLKTRAQAEKDHLCAMLDAYSEGLYAMLAAANKEYELELRSPIVPETHKSLDHAA